MTLDKYMTQEGIGDQEMAARCGCSRMQMYRIRRGVNMPRMPLIGAIERETGGKVTANDLLEKWLAQ